ncbi:MAG: hypothetical protein JXL80_08635 [Planctomycetes bacterium]|nr:hypothetical protein [Planctomycetota bacterium]
MAPNPLRQILDTITGLTGAALAAVILAAIVLVLVLIVWRVLSGRRRGEPERRLDLNIDVMALGTHDAPIGGPVLEFYNVPVRLAAVVVAPAGRVRPLPDALDDVFDAIVPGMARVVAIHRPVVRRWPPQLSAKGFAHMFFQHVRLPGEGGKGTPWSSAAGLLKIEGQPLMAGLVLRTESPSSHGQEIVQKEEQWLSMLRVKGA